MVSETAQNLTCRHGYSQILKCIGSYNADHFSLQPVRSLNNHRAAIEWPTSTTFVKPSLFTTGCYSSPKASIV